MTYLPDVSIWIALASDRHVHHSSAKQWLNGVTNDRIAFCRIVELGLLRLLTNRHVMQNDVLEPVQAWREYDNFRADPRIVFLRESQGFGEVWRQAESEISSGPNSWTDAYLAVFAKHASATVVTFDRGFKSIGGCEVLVIT
jgi:toxin-antitoxin system PIN domain toxin